jgi:hypothetical protein
VPSRQPHGKFATEKVPDTFFFALLDALTFQLDPAGLVRHVRTSVQSIKRLDYKTAMTEIGEFIKKLQRYGDVRFE